MQKAMFIELRDCLVKQYPSEAERIRAWLGASPYRVVGYTGYMVTIGSRRDAERTETLHAKWLMATTGKQGSVREQGSTKARLTLERGRSIRLKPKS